MHKKASRDEIRLAYRKILMREADQGGLESYVNSGLSISDIKERLKSSREYKDRVEPVAERIIKNPGKKILIFGAYGNGNLGDAVQAKFILKGLREAGYQGEVWATSYLKGHYHFPEEYKLPSWVIKSHSILEMFDIILIGGGGLLSHPHYPLNDKKWAEDLSTPIALISVGATNFAALDSELLIKKSLFVSARDEVSLRCLRQFREDAVMLRDPVLCMQDYRAPRAIGNKKMTAWVLKGPMTNALQVLRSVVKDDDLVIGFEKKVDEEIEELFPEIIYTPTDFSFCNQIKNCSTVFSMRYHGIILSLPYVNKVCGIGDQKNKSLFLDLGVESGYFQGPDCILKDEGGVSCDESIDFDRIKRWKVEFLHHLRSNLIKIGCS